MKNLITLILLVFPCLLMAKDTLSVKESSADITNITIETLSLYKAKIDSISEASIKTSINTEPTDLTKTDWDEYLNIGLALIAAIGTFLTVLVIYLDTRQNSINKTIQEELFKDLIRHFYRNIVVLGAIKIKLDGNYDKAYPSEEHILKFKVLPEDLRVDRFSSSHVHYQKLHKLELQLRNFDIEVDVAMDHLKSKKIDEADKIRDLKNLEFKCGHLSNFVLEVLQELKFKFYTLNDAKDFLLSLNEDKKVKKDIPEENYRNLKNAILEKNNITIKLLEDKKKYKFYRFLGDQVHYNLYKDIINECENVNTINF